MEKRTTRQAVIKAVDYARSILPTASTHSCWAQLARLDAETVDPKIAREILTPGYEYMIPVLKCNVCESTVDEILCFEFDVDTCAQTQLVFMCQDCVRDAAIIMG